MLVFRSMIESIMYFGIGFLFAALIGLAVIPSIHARAVRLTMRRLENSIPQSMAEIQANKDALRAELALSTRRLEMTVEQLKEQATSQLAELGQKGDAINRLKIEREAQKVEVVALKTELGALKERLTAACKEVEAAEGQARDPYAGRDSSDQGIGVPRERSDFSAGLQVTEPSIHVSPRASGYQFVRIFIAALIGVGATFAWQSHGDEAKEIVRTWVPSLAWLFPASTTKSPPDAAAEQTGSMPASQVSAQDAALPQLRQPLSDQRRLRRQLLLSWCSSPRRPWSAILPVCRTA